MSKDATVGTDKKAGSFNKIFAVLGIMILITVLAFSIHLLIGSARATDAEAPRRQSIAGSYLDITLPANLSLLEHQSVTTGTPSEVYFYTYTGDKLALTNNFAANLANAGYSLTKSNDGLIFSASKNGSITLNFTFSQPNQLKVVAI